ncbi:hypothetical protein HPB51_004059 [Rhipicephalus microplus]|uniref:Uncharacterized protein n=1 Tax=Rhipicephalus microplus TaxID=6941 RepID=A0A9J6EWN4_RHIMP|nr:hypothetical protein HPB51_004059 [Rhipicephalus microplus]
MSTVIVPKRDRRRKPKQLFGFESTSRPPDNTPPSNAETDLRKLLVHLRMQQEALHAFLDHSLRFEAIYEDLYTFAYYRGTDDRNDVLDETSRIDCGLQDAMVSDGVHQRTSALSSDSGFYGSTSGGGYNEPATPIMRNAWVPSLRLHHSRALKATQQTCDPKLQTQECDPSRITKLTSALKKRDVQITELK